MLCFLIQRLKLASVVPQRKAMNFCVEPLASKASISVEALAAKLEERATYVQRELEQNRQARNQSRGRFT